MIKICNHGRNNKISCGLIFLLFGFIFADYNNQVYFDEYLKYVTAIVIFSRFEIWLFYLSFTVYKVFPISIHQNNAIERFARLFPSDVIKLHALGFFV